jgi:succinoglycan biosynthesis transport protein ExoP
VQNFLQRQQQANQGKSFPVQAARVISEADVPTAPSSPRKSLMMVVGLILGFAGGTAFGAVREFRDRFFRTGDQIRKELAIEFLGLVPIVTQRATDDHDQAAGSRRSLRTWQAMNYVVEEPLSAFAETMRRIKIAVDMAHIDNGPKVIGVVSVLPREGKSTVSANLARLIASQGARTLLIDADLRGLGLTRVMASDAQSGLLEVLLENLDLATVARKDPKTKMVFLPSVARREISHTADVLASTAMGNFLAEAGASFDYIIVDLPPLAPVADASAFARHLDAAVMVVEWGGIARTIVRSTLASEPELASKMVGAVLNKVDVEKMKLYSDFGSNEYYYGRYSSYYTNS